MLLRPDYFRSLDEKNDTSFVGNFINYIFFYLTMHRSVSIIKNGLRPKEVGKKDILAAKFEIENEQTFQFKQLYKIMYEWLMEEGWGNQYVPDNKKLETLYYEKTFQGGMQEHAIWWRCQRNPHGNRYFRYVMKIDFQTIGMGKTEVLHKGAKFKTYVGDIVLRVESWLQLDYKNEWMDHWLLKHFDRVFRQRVYRKNIELYKQDLYNDTYRFQQMIKQFLKLKNPMQMGESFHPQRGI